MEDPHQSSIFLKDCTLRENPTVGQFSKNCSLWEGLTLLKFVEDCFPWQGPHVGAGGSMRSPPPEEKGMEEMTHDELNTVPVPLRAGRGKVRKIRIEVDSEKKRGVGKSLFYFSLPYYELIGNK